MTRKSSNSPCVLEGEWERRCSGMRNISGPFAATSKMAYFGTSRAKIAFLASPFWHYVFSGFSETRFCFAKSRRATQKHKNEDGRGPRNKLWPILEDSDFKLRVAISRLEMQTSIFLAALDIFALAKKCQLHTHLNPEGSAIDKRPKFCFRVPHFQHGAPRHRRIFRAPVAILGALLNPTKHCGNGVLWHRTLSAPFLNGCPGLLSND